MSSFLCHRIKLSRCILLFSKVALVIGTVASNDAEFIEAARESNKSISNDGRVLVQAAGASFPNRIYQEAIFAYQFENRSVDVSYQATGSGKGKCRVMNYYVECDNPFNPSNENGANFDDNVKPYFVDFAGSDSLLKDEDYDQYPDLQMYPAVAGAVVPIINIPELGDNRFVLREDVIARIFRKCFDATPECDSSITTWDDPDIYDEQSAATQAAIDELISEFGNEIEVVVRNDKSGTSEIFKKTLSNFDPVYATRIGDDSDNKDYGVNATVTKQNTNAGVAAYVIRTPGSIGYSVLGEAIALGAKFADIRKGDGKDLVASVDTVINAVLEKGLQFDAPTSRLTADINNALGSQAWPIVGYSYFVMRKNVTREGGTCQNKYATVKFIEWFYTDPVIGEIASSLGFAVLPDKIRDFVLDTFRQQIFCDDEQVWIPPPDLNVRPNVWTQPFFSATLSLFTLTFETIKDLVILTEKTVTDVSAAISDVGNGNGMAFVLGNDHISSLPKDLLSIPYAAVGMGAVFNFCGSSGNCFSNLSDTQENGIVMTTLVLAKVFNGSITSWDHPDIRLLNPNATLPNEPIIIIGQQHDDLSVLFESFLREEAPGINLFENSFINETSTERTRAIVGATQFSIAYTPIVGEINTELINYVSIQRDIDNSIVKPSDLSIAACGEDTFTQTPHARFDLRSSMNSACYPFVESINVVAKSSFSGSACDVGVGTTNFLGFLYNKLNGITVSIQTPLKSQSIGPLFPLHATVNEKLLFSISCDGSSILNPPENKNLIPFGLIALGYFAFACHIIAVIYFSRMVRKHRDSVVIRNSSPQFLQQLLYGSIIGMSTIIPLGIQDSDDSPDDPEAQQLRLDRACQMAPFLYTVGFVLVYSAIWLKTWRLHKLFNNPKLIKLKIHNRKLQLIQGMVLIVTVMINLLWWFFDPLRFERTIFEVAANGKVTSFAYCTSDYWEVFIVPLSTMLFASIFYGIYLLYAIWFIPSDFNESKWISFALVTAFESLLVAIPVLFIADNEPTIRFMVLFLVILSTMFIPIMFLMVPKITEVKGIKTKYYMDTSNSFTRPNDHISDQSPHSRSGERQDGSASNSKRENADNRI